MMRQDLLAKRLFMAGCFGLPWLWAVHLMYWWGKEKARAASDDRDEDDRTEGLLDAETIEPQEDQPADPEEMRLEEKKWVRRELLGLVMASLAWTTWILVFRILGEDFFGPKWYVRSEDEGEFTGW